ncbi:hypothetical protein ACQPZ8_25870 [Actinomadura nitritigenes]|uniref:hypothetical protein n=1 Tax=Actinomadura nitritigenes TaxID=134602 RepID=UPI0036C65A3E
MNGTPAPVTGTWVHAFEEDTPAEAVYRPEGHPLPPARRPRRRLEFRADGTLTEHRPAPDDRLAEREGRWERRGPGRVAVAFPGGHGAPVAVSVSSAGDRLVVER